MLDCLRVLCYVTLELLLLKGLLSKCLHMWVRFDLHNRYVFLLLEKFLYVRQGICCLREFTVKLLSEVQRYAKVKRQYLIFPFPCFSQS